MTDDQDPWQMHLRTAEVNTKDSGSGNVCEKININYSHPFTWHSLVPLKFQLPANISGGLEFLLMKLLTSQRPISYWMWTITFENIDATATAAVAAVGLRAQPWTKCSKLCFFLYNYVTVLIDFHSLFTSFTDAILLHRDAKHWNKVRWNKLQLRKVKQPEKY